MSLKKSSSIFAKKRKVVRTTVELKKEIISKLENGVRVSDLAKHYNIAKSTVSTIFKNKEAIKAAKVAKGVTTIYSKQRPQIIDEVEMLLKIWVKERELAGESTSDSIICDKAMEIYTDLLEKIPNTSSEGENKFTFKASRGWLEKFKHRSGIYGVFRHRESTSSIKKAAEKYADEFHDFVNAEGYVPQQVFNCDETGLYWKKLPNRTFITVQEKLLPGHQPMKDKISLLLCSNASGDCKIKPLVIYHSENPEIFKRNNVMKSKLPVMWRSNVKSWCTRQFFVEWVYEIFGPQVKEYLEEKQLPLKCLLIMDNDLVHPQDLNDDLPEGFDFIKVKFLPFSVTPLLQPMNQLVISNFKKIYTRALFQKCFEATIDLQLTLRDFWKNNFTILNCLTLIDNAWTQVTYKTLNFSWKNLWSDSVVEQDFEGFQFEETAIIDDIVSMGKSIGLKVESEDIYELLDSHRTELNSKDLQNLQGEVQKTLVSDLSPEEDENRESVSSSLIQEMCMKWGDVQLFVEKYHPDMMLVNKAVYNFNDIMMHFRKILQQRHIKETMENIFVKEKSQPALEIDNISGMKIETIDIKMEKDN